jgi:hypothetical protein
LAVHFDVDLVDLLDAPLAENTDRGTAPSLIACERCSVSYSPTGERALLRSPSSTPHHGADDGDTTRRLIEVLIRALCVG